MTRLLGSLALLAFILSAAGIYGVLSFSTSQRTREIGVRIAVGAHTRDIVGLVVGEGMRVVSLGVLIGLAGSLALSRLLTASLYQVSPTDPITLVSTTLVLGSVALMACYLPARRAARVDPIVALRCE